LRNPRSFVTFAPRPRIPRATGLALDLMSFALIAGLFKGAEAGFS